MTPFDLQHHHRRSIRLPGYDYTQPGAYFVSLVTQGRECLFGEVAGGEMRLNRCGEIVCRGWVDLPHHYPHAVLDAFICMPNHVHGIVILRDDVGRGGSVPGEIVMLSREHSGELCSPDSAQTRPYESGEIVMPSEAHSGELCAPDSAQTRPYESGEILMPSRAQSGELCAPDGAQTHLYEGGDGEGRGGSVSGKGLKQNEITSGMVASPESGQTRPYEATRYGLPEIIRAFKSFSARRINILRRTPGIPVWQRNYYEHIVRDDADLSRIRAYILDNPRRWDLDQENPLKSG